MAKTTKTKVKVEKLKKGMLGKGNRFADVDITPRYVKKDRKLTQRDIKAIDEQTKDLEALLKDPGAKADLTKQLQISDIPISDNQIVHAVRSQPSVEIKKDAKGNVSFTVKVYSDDMEDAYTKAVDIAERLVAMELQK